MRSTQGRIFTWVFVAIALTFWVMQARRGNPFLNAREVTITELGEETKQHKFVQYLGSDEAFHYFQPAGEMDAFFFAARDRKIFKLPGDAWTAPEQKLSRYLPVLVTVKDGKLTVANMRDLGRRRGDPDSGEDQDYIAP
jgi:hypothetical protein